MDTSLDSDSSSSQAAKDRAAFLRRQFGFYFLWSGLLWLVVVFRVVQVVQAGALGMSALVGVGLGLGTYTLIWGVRAWRRASRAAPGATKYDRAWLMQAVHEDRVLAEVERPAAQETARKLLWNRRRRASQVFWPSLMVILVVRSLLTRHHTDAGAAANVLLILLAILAQWGHVLQARPHRWMAANHIE